MIGALTQLPAEHPEIEVLRRQHHSLAVQRLQQLMERRELDAIILLRRDNFTYVNAHCSIFLDLGWQGQAAIVVPRGLAPFGICTDFDIHAETTNGLVKEWIEVKSWVFVEYGYLPSNAARRPAGKTHFHDTGQILQAAARELRAIGRASGRIGIEQDALITKVARGLPIAFPDAELVNVESDLDRLRYVKTRYEIECLRFASATQWHAVSCVMKEVRIGTSHRDIVHGIREVAERIPGVDAVRFLACYMGPHFSPTARHYETRAQAGELITFDIGFQVRGYVSDSARSFVLGEPNADQRRIEGIFKTAHDLALAEYRPGAVPKEIYSMAIAAVHAGGLPHYARGHVGHGLGLSDFVEEWPWIDGTEETPLAEDSIFTLEIPYYAHVFGSYMDEDVIHVKAGGAEVLTPLDRGLHVIG